MCEHLVVCGCYRQGTYKVELILDLREYVAHCAARVPVDAKAGSECLWSCMREWREVKKMSV
jgi:REP element-mobilizing transposase RayT